MTVGNMAIWVRARTTARVITVYHGCVLRLNKK